MAIPAHADQVAFLLPVLVDEEPAQGQLWPTLDVVNVVDHRSTAELSPGFAELALVPILTEDISAQAPPLWCDVEGMYVAVGNQLPQPIQKLVSHVFSGQNKKSQNQQPRTTA